MSDGTDEGQVVEDDDDETENDGIDEEEESEPIPPKPTPPKAKAKAGPIVHPKGFGRPRGRIGAIPETPFINSEAELLWPEILAELPKTGMSAYDLQVRVVRLEPGTRQQLGQSFEASSIVGDATTSPADAILRVVTDFYHMATARSPVLYDIQFIWKTSGKLYAHGRLRCPSPAEIVALRNSDLQRQAASDQGLGQVGQGFGMPRPLQQQAPFPMQPPLYPQPFPYGYMPQQVPDPGYQRESPEIMQLREEIRLLRERAALGQSQPAPAVPTAPAVPAAPPTTEELVERVATRVLGALGVGVQRPGAPGGLAGLGGLAGFGAPPLPPPPQAVAGDAQAAVSSFKSLVSTVRELRTLGKTLDGVFADDFQPPVTPDAMVLSAPSAPVDDPLDFSVANVGADIKWRDGRPVKIARSKDSGQIDWMGVALANPIVSETLMDKFGGIGAALMGKLNPGAASAPKPALGAAPTVPPLPAQQEPASPASEPPEWNLG